MDGRHGQELTSDFRIGTWRFQRADTCPADAEPTCRGPGGIIGTGRGEIQP